jgi:hypothetical protein
MARFDIFAMFREVPGTPTANIPILAKQGDNPVTWIVGHDDFIGKKYLVSGVLEPDIELDVFDVRKRLVVPTDRIECRDGHQGVVSMIDPSASCCVPMKSATIPQKGVLRRGGGALEAVFARRMHRDNDGVRLRSALDLQQPLAKGSGILRVGVRADEKSGVAAKSLNRTVDSCTLNFLWVLHERDSAVALCQAFDDRLTAVFAATIGDDNSQVEMSRVRENGGYDGFDVTFLIQARHNDEDSSRRASYRPILFFHAHGTRSGDDGV